jgi:CHAT domain-containing protein
VLEAASRGFDRLILIASDGLDFLPLHAAWTENAGGARRYALDVMPMSLAASAGLQPSHDGRGWVAGQTLLGVAEPAPVDAAPLPAARIEVGALQDAFVDTSLEGEAATKEAVTAAIPNADIVHMACHGFAHFGLPYASSLIMANNVKLAVSDIVDIELDRRPFVFLSACETGAHDLELADEVQSISGAFIAAGATGVVSTLWSVIDLPALLITLKVYDHLLAGHDPVRALREAQLWMRDLPAEDVARDVKAMQWVLASVRENISGQLRDSNLDLSAPLNWAAHVYSGA